MGTHPIFESDFDCLTEMELQEETGETNRLLEDIQISDAKQHEEWIPYKYISPTSGDQHEVRVKVAIQGDPKSYACFLTLHDIGMNPQSQFGSLMNCELFEPLRSKFCSVHISVPGMEASDSAVQAGCYPTMDQMAEMIPYIIERFGLKRIFLFGVGVGANVFLRYCLNDQSKIEGCIFVNPVFSQQTWGDYFHAKVFGTSTGPDFLNWYHFRNDLISDMLKDCKEAHQQAFQKLNQNNLKEFVEAVNKRTAINLVRTELGKSNLRVPSILFVGDASPFNEDTAELNSRLNPSITTFVKMADAGSMILEQQPMKVAEALILYLKGLGYFASLNHTDISLKRHRAVKLQQDLLEAESAPPLTV